ncbi:MAG: DNA helicase RecQ [Fuerstiella sp.]|nr:DNA helicase RecQ [Fuerstiella sp.]
MSSLSTTTATDRTEKEQLRTALKQYWGYDSFRPMQLESMQLVMQKHDSVVVLPTGGGKSLCYQVPAVCRNGMAIIVSPLIALMKDQVDALTACGVAAAFVNSSQSLDERRSVAQRVTSGELKMLFAAPERLVQETTIQFLRQISISFIAIDEAHCISHWGHDFRPEYRQLHILKAAFPDVSFHAFTATATERVRSDICHQMELTDPKVLVGSFDRPNLTYRVERRCDAITQIRSVLQRRPGESGIIYCISRSNVEETSNALNTLGYRTLPYHAGLDADVRKKHQESFINDEVDIIVATVAFGMGIDKSNVRFVIHAEMPRSVEAWQQESGRAGRDGLEADCWLFFSGRDVNTWEFLIDQSETEDNRVASRAALSKMELFCISHRCRHLHICAHFGETLDITNCGACDICLEETELVTDATVIAQKILSGVYRQNQGFGASYTCQVLRGSRNRKILGNGHHRLSTWGLLKDEPEHVVRSWIDQLIGGELLVKDGEHSVLKVTEAGWEVMRSNRQVTLSRPRPRRQSATVTERWDGVDRELFEHLRGIRMEIAADLGVPPYVIFGDVTLRELAKRRPTTAAGILHIYGIGAQKQEQFGAQFTYEISQWCKSHALDHDLSPDDHLPTASSTPKSAESELTSTSSRYFELFEQGHTIDEVCRQLDRAQSTVAGYLIRFVRLRNINDPSTWVPAEKVTIIEAAIAEHGHGHLKRLFEALNREISLDHIRIVIACQNNR